MDYGHGAATRSEPMHPMHRDLMHRDALHRDALRHDHHHLLRERSPPVMMDDLLFPMPGPMDDLDMRAGPPSPPPARSTPPGPPPVEEPQTVSVEDLLGHPGRDARPAGLREVLSWRRLLKELEMGAAGSVAPRVLALDDYFMQEVEVADTDPDTGKREFRYEYEADMEDAYFSSLLKSFRKTVDGRLFSFVIVDAVLATLAQLEQFAGYARTHGFQVYMCEPECLDPEECHRRNTHGRSLEDIKKIVDSWEPAPKHYPRVDCSVLINEMECDMEEELPPADAEGGNGEGGTADADEDEEDEEEPVITARKLAQQYTLFTPCCEALDEALFFGLTLHPSIIVHKPSRWELVTDTEKKGEQLLKLDGLSSQRLKHTSMDDYLQLPDDYEQRDSQPGKKRVRWADIEESKQQKRVRDIGFVVGQTDWSKFTDPSQAEKALTRTKYI
ncbi:hypothetical protein HPB48_008817 [Haemaphysalis longicornis]|uniref:Uncharacterized protein n=1 Tax=Haemaphysalis longicornis TaxID=44386 RepID=A0A9J6GZ62_HAELO|nr:hypothetical protein HPB48_008817 [Haemaphysalis longicornis]